MDGAITPEGMDAAYLASTNRSHRERFAQFFTPPDLAALMADWVAQTRPRTILDPALGTGILTRAVASRLPDARVTGCEVDPRIAAQARRAIAISGLTVAVREGDFMAMPTDETFDAIIANPPYLRHSAFPNAARHAQRIGDKCGLTLSRQTNAYALFLLDCCARLRPGGRLAFLIPSEWMNANFGAPIRKHLVESGLLRAILCASHERSVFEDALTTACLVLAENTPMTGPVRTAHLGEHVALPDLRTLFGPTDALIGAVVRDLSAEDLLTAPKWDALLRARNTVTPAGFVRLGELASTRRGIATGANAFFHISRDAAFTAGLSTESLTPCVGRARHVTGLTFTIEDIQRLDASGQPAHLVRLRAPLSPAEAAYVQSGEDAGYHERHITSKRRPWHDPEAPRIAPIWAAVFGRERMRFVRNRTGTAHLSTFHGVYPNRSDVAFLDALTTALNSDTVQALMRAQTRVYGGGLSKVEPKDLLEIPVPDLRRCTSGTLRRLGRALGSPRADDLMNRAVQEILGDPHL